MRRPTPPRERRGGTCPPARPGGSYEKHKPVGTCLDGFVFFPATSNQPVVSLGP